MLLVSSQASAEPLPQAAASAVAMRPGFSADIDRAVAEQLEAKKMPGCVVVVGRHGSIVHKQAYGNRSLQPEVEPMTLDTVFDMASLTKPIATSTSIMRLVERGDVRLRDKVTKYFPEFAAHGKDDITVEQLLIHAGGLAPVIATDKFTDDTMESMLKICEMEPVAEPGEVFKYSDLGFLMLGAIVQKASGQPLDEYSREQVFLPLGMQETMFNPNEQLCQRAAITEQVDGTWLQGVVHDPRARKLGGVAGHAGLFSTADDLAIYAQTLLNNGQRNNVSVVLPQTLREWTTPREIAGNKRGLGWDMGSVYSRNRGETMSPKAFGHGGFTGTSMWIDPELDLFVIFLSNRVHPNGKGEVNDLAGRIGTIAASACLNSTPEAPAESSEGKVAQGPVKLGIEVLAANHFDVLEGKRVGLIANHTSCDSQRKSTIEILAEAPEVNLVALFSPEHGLKGVEDHANIGDTTHEATKLPVYSLYGETRKPTKEQLDGVDVIVFDIQDIGCRFYTYLSTMGLAMEAAAEQGKTLVVLDRPNPIGGKLVEGPVLDSGSESFVGFHPIPVRHGMTLGELAQMIKSEKSIDVELIVVKTEGWHREDYQYSTGLPWIDTSPNMRSLTEAVLYPGVGLFETTNVSVGRGTDTPFEVLGAPWIDGNQLAEKINAYQLAGVRVLPVQFTPTASKFEGESCGGVNFVITDWDEFRPVDLAWAIGSSLVELYSEDWESKRFNRLLSNRAVLDALVGGAGPQELKGIYEADLAEFQKRRSQFLAY
ncbi:exo-beta-N-acetylmuramidase NamZ domain-containing protein [Aeoliella mucimassa]|uniref:exo-beta-N-acetylmuramidase NamZ domain-containing protein n=1 Tax=Aeoliella mucimassa TaxID=2527972 RepID=UPI001E4DED8B|nr:exo-beta-N-acetylmuramidase NamZ domain-containing protein [Aeoliella mucimassa]